jgi:hypothetical protein
MKTKLLILFVIASISKQSYAQIITTVAGNGTAGFSGDGGQATSAQLKQPNAVTLDATQNIYITDTENNRIRKVNSLGIITTIVGGGTSGIGDGGQATAAELSMPSDVILDALANMYIVDCWHQRIRKVNTAGIISTIAGDGIVGFSGDGGQATAARLNYPNSVVFDNIGNLYIADLLNHRIRKVNTLGIINTIAGTGVAGYSGDGGTATAAELNKPGGVTFDAKGNLYIADYNITE